MGDETLYLAATKEVDEERTDAALWAKAMALTDGDIHKAKYKYINLRVEQLTDNSEEVLLNRRETSNKPKSPDGGSFECFTELDALKDTAKISEKNHPHIISSQSRERFKSLLIKHCEKIFWFSTNSVLPWSVDFIKRFEKELEWNGYYGLTGNEGLPWSKSFIEQFEEKWYWKDARHPEYSNLADNAALPWGIELIERFEEKWYWGRLSKDKTLPWSIGFIERFRTRWYWSDLSSNKQVPWSDELIRKFEVNWCWQSLSSNEALPWSVELIAQYEEKWDWEAAAESMDQQEVVNES